MAIDGIFSDEPGTVALDVPQDTPNAQTSLPPVGGGTVIPSPQLAKNRSAKMAQGIGPSIEKSQDDIYQHLLAGDEAYMRKQAALKADAERSIQQQQIIQEIAKKSGGPLGPQDVQAIRNVLDPYNPANTPADPNDVVERAYAKDYVSTLIGTATNFMKDTIMPQAQADTPRAVNDTLLQGSELLTKNQYMLTALQNNQQRIDQQSYLGYGFDFARNLAQPYVEARLRDQLGEGFFAGLGLGSSLDEAHSLLMRMPMAEFKQKFDAAMARLSNNPQLAAQWGQAMLGQDTFESNLNSVFSAMMVPDALAVGKLGAKAVKSIDRVNQVRKATKDLVSAAAKDPTGSPVTRSEAVGDLAEAAVQKVDKALTDAANGVGNPIEMAHDTLLSTWYDWAKKVTANPGTYMGRELVTRTADGIVRSGEDLYQRLATSNRAERTPAVISNPDSVRALQQAERVNYKGPANTLLDISEPIREPVSGTYWWKSTLGNYDGTLFPDAETAQGFARQLGLANPIIKGQEAAKVYVPETAITKTDKGFTTAKGSEYTIHPDGTTTRVKGHGDVGEKPRSELTGYIKPDEYAALQKAAKEGTYAESVDNGKINLFTDAKNRVFITASDTPKEGLIPVEMLPGNKIHYGNEITKMGKKTSKIEEFTQEGNHVRIKTDDGYVVTSPEPKSGYIPYNLKTKQFEKALTDETAKIEQQGLGFYIEKWHPMKEDGDMVRDLLIKDTKGEFIPDAISKGTDAGNIASALTNWLRNSEDTLAINESAQRKAVTYAQNNIHKWADELAQDLRDIANGRIKEDPVTGERLNRAMVYPKSWINRFKDREIAKQFQRTLDFGRREFDADGNPGKFFDTPVDLADFYQRNFKRDPSYLETKAYFNFVKLIEGDRMMREVAEFKYRGRLGTEQHSVSYFDQKTGEKITSPFFDGIAQKHFPGGDEQMLVIHENQPPTIIKLDQQSKLHESLKESVKEGRAKVIQIYDRNQMPLKDFSDVTKDQLIRYVLTDKSETKPITFNHVARRGGGHFEWDYDFYLKQADVRKQNIGKGLEYAYVGDTTVMPIKTRKLGADVVKLWNEAHEHIKNNEWDKVKPIAQKLGIKYDEFTSWYHPGRDANGNPTRPLLNAHEPIVVVDRNKKISEMGSDLQNRYRVPRKDGNGFTELFRDATKSGPENNFKVQYNQERNSSINTRTINDVGSQGNPIYAHQPAEMVDPLTTMNRALNRVINSTFMDDYKIMSVEHWLREAAPYLNASEAELRSAPFAWFNKPEWRAAVKDTPAVMNLMSNRMKVNQFVGMPSKFDTWIHSLTTSLVDSAYEKYGPEASRNLYQKAKTIVPIWMLNHVDDPVQWIRSVTFNFKLGLFAIPQFLVQAQTHSLIWALEPKHGTVGTYSMLLHGWAHFTENPQILASLDKYATKLNGFGSKWRPGEWLEARKELEKSGFSTVAGEYSNLDNQLKTRFFLNDWEKGLKLGQAPFRLGEQTTRLTAWYTAFREFRELNPTTPITNIERSKILSKADLLTVNMSRASNSALSHGVLSLSTQFLSYQIKLAELFISKRLGETPTERLAARARILSAFSLLYGVPNAIGVTGLPFSDNVREHFQDTWDYIPGEKWWSTAMMEGLPAWSMAMMTGKLDNVGDRFGSQGFQNIKQMLRGDVPFAIALGGAGVSTGWNFAKAFADPYYQWYNSWARGDNADDRFTITGADLLQPWKEISSVSTAAKLWAAIQTGKWISKNEQSVTDVTPLHAALLAATGLSPQDQDTIFLQNQMLKGETDAKKKAMAGFIVDWRRGIQTRSDDESQSISYYKNAMSRARVAGMSPQEINTAIAVATRAAGTNAIDDSNYNVWAKGDYNKRDQRLEQLRTKEKMKDQQ